MPEFATPFHAWHNQGICALTPEELENRIAEVLQDKPKDELDLRLHYLGMAVNIPQDALAELDGARAEWYKVRATWNKAWAEWDTALAERDRAWAEWDKALAEWNAKWHKKLCHPNCAWTPQEPNIFAKGKSLARLLEGG